MRLRIAHFQSRSSHQHHAAAAEERQASSLCNLWVSACGICQDLSCSMSLPGSTCLKPVFCQVCRADLQNMSRVMCHLAPRSYLARIKVLVGKKHCFFLRCYLLVPASSDCWNMLTHLRREKETPYWAWSRYSATSFRRSILVPDNCDFLESNTTSKPAQQ